MREWCDKALRKAICRRIAEAGASPHEIMSVSGHITLAEAQRYCDDFGRKGLADSAIARLPHGAKMEQNLANHPARFAKNSANNLKEKEKYMGVGRPGGTRTPNQGVMSALL
ncbi:hypothetical protein SAMN04488103_102522 [Gemmobacter aquatilis]|uniref:Phage integrase family protein n=1 Tax=Gemmobacter aquatilis TaxID=933059 RepID=A0A1H8CKF6_9RHOB|nr:hypothetical protein SAMN04488103_102522 [Gemmobacter aquatilis]